jgi:hypothetical protein
MTDLSSRRGMARIAIYYLVFGLVTAALYTQVPVVERTFNLSNLSTLNQEIFSTLGGTPSAGAAADRWLNLGMEEALLSMLAALGLMVPVAMVYLLIKRRAGYDESVVHALLILPVAVTGIVMIVQNSLALAFSLAGIVAAVRFRTTLDDTKDAVYIFLAIGVGLACGVQAPSVALVLSVVFNAVNLLLWRTGFGNIYRDQGSRSASLHLGEVLAGPESGGSAVAVGDQQLLHALTPRDLTDVATRVARMERYLDAESDTQKDRKEFHVLLVHASQVGAAQEVVERHLEDNALRWRLAEIIPGAGEVSVLEYLVRLHDHCSPGGLLDLVRSEGGDRVLAAEIRSLKGLKRKR